MGCIPSRQEVEMDGMPQPRVRTESARSRPLSLPPWVTRRHQVFDPDALHDEPKITAREKDIGEEDLPQYEEYDPHSPYPILPQLNKTITISSDPFASRGKLQ